MDQTLSLHEAWAREELFRRGDHAWTDPAVSRIFNAWLARNETDAGWGDLDSARAAFRAVPGGPY